MKLITSISPSHNSFESQKRAIKSWLDLGFEVVSLNHESEIEKLSEFNEVLFVKAKETQIELFGKHLVKIDEMIEFFDTQEQQLVIIINSDIELYDEIKVNRMLSYAKNGICITSRYNYEEDRNINEIEKWGLDVFAFNKEYSKIIPKSNHTLGKPLFDYFIPYHFAIHSLPIYSIHDRIAFHKNHSRQWNANDWRLMSKDFRKIFSKEEIPDRKLSQIIRRRICNHAQIIGYL